MKTEDRIDAAAELLDDSRNMLTDEGFDQRREALDVARTTSDVGEAHRMINYAIEGLGS